jgi:hypothetical protein
MSTNPVVQPKVREVKATVSYLPATKPFRQEYAPDTPLQTVRSEAMAYFGVQDYTDRDQHQFFLEFEGNRVTDYALSLAALLDEKKKAIKLELVEQVTAGGL